MRHFLLFLIACGFGAFVWRALRKRHRDLWRKLGSLELELRKQDSSLIELKKQLTLMKFPDLRLPAAMPSQHGEDLLLWRLFDGRRDGYFVEAGAYDGRQLSNTYFLEAVGWTGLLIEPNPDRYSSCVRSRPYSRCVQAALVANTPPRQITLHIPRGGEEWYDALASTEKTRPLDERFAGLTVSIGEVEVPARTLDELLEGAPVPIQLLSLDLEGGELEALHGLDLERWQPEVVLVEDNSNGRDRAVVDYLTARGYEERLRLSMNIFFLRAGDRRTFAD